MNKNKNLAFTLAEVLIVIGIIGVVAALTLPNLNHATGDKERITKVKKIYSTLNDAFERAQVVYGDAESWYDYAAKNGIETDMEFSDLFSNRITEFIKIAKITNSIDEYTPKFIKLADNTEFNFHIKNPFGPSHYAGKNYFGFVLVDLDGFDKGKDTYGYDKFKFDITDQGIYPEGNVDDYISNENCFMGGYCSRWILENDNADYLKADENGKCNDSNIILDGTTNTSCH